MKVDELVYLLTQACDDYDDDVAKAAALNRAIRYFYDKTAPYVDKNSTYTAWLYPLKCGDVALGKLKSGKDFDLYKFPEKWGRTLRLEIDVSKKGCPDNSFQVHPRKSKSIGGERNSRYGKASYAFEHSFYEYVKEGLRIYHSNDFSISNAEITYLQKIPKIKFTDGEARYVYPDGEVVDSNVDLLIGEGAEEPIIQIASILKGRSALEIQTELNRILNLKNII